MKSSVLDCFRGVIFSSFAYKEEFQPDQDYKAGGRDILAPMGVDIGSYWCAADA